MAATTITYTVTVATGKFLIDGANKPKLSFRAGDTYVFDQTDSSNASNTLRFSATSDNSGASEYTTGVSITGSPGSTGKTTIVCDGSTTATLYYYSGDTSGFGAEFSNSGYNTTSEGVLKPVVGAASEKWGPMLNHSLEQIEASSHMSRSTISKDTEIQSGYQAVWAGPIEVGASATLTISGTLIVI